MARRARPPAISFAFLGFREEWYVLRADTTRHSGMDALGFEGRVVEWLVSQRITPGTWSHFGRGNTGDYPLVPDDDDHALYLLLKRPADVLRCEATFPCTGITSEALLAAVRAEARVHRFVLDDVVKIAHNTIRNLILTFGEGYPTWDNMDGETRVSFTLQIQHRLAHPNEPVEQLHERWVADRRRDGWQFGGQHNAQRLTDPLLVPWKNLNLRTQTRYHLLASVVSALAPLLA